MNRIFRVLCTTAAAWGLAQAATAHVVLADKTAAAGSYHRATFKVGHGCDGSATTAIRVTLPSGFRGAKPMPKAGWQIAIRREKLATAYQSHGKSVTDDVAEITWTASPGQALPDAFYDEFVMQGQIAEQPGPMWFKVLQRCEQGQIDWAEIPARGTGTKGLKVPAALLEVTPAMPAGHVH